jgi:hypothetical protein
MTDINKISIAISEKLKTSEDFIDYLYEHVNYPASVKLGEAVSGYYEYAYYENGGASIKTYTGKEENCIIPETLDGYTVIAIFPYAFEGNNYIKNVVIPSSMLFISRDVFRHCTSLQSVSLNNILMILDNAVFRGCKSLKEISIPDSVTEFGDSMFLDCLSLENVTIGKNITITDIGSGTFWGCKKITAFDIPHSVTLIPGCTFKDCDNLKKVTFPEGLTIIGGETFSGCPRLKIESFPDGLKKIEHYAFEDCTSLGKIVIPDSVEEISGCAFIGCINVVFSTTKGTYAEAYAREHSISIYYSDTGETWTPNLEYKISQFFKKPEPTTNG